MKKLLYFIDNKFEEIVLSAMMAYFVFATTMQVIARFVLKIPMPWTEETARYVQIWMTFLGCAYAAKKGTHIRVDILEGALKKNGKYVRYLSVIIFLAFTVIMTYVGINLCRGMIAKPQYSSVLKMRMIFLYLALPVGMALTAIRTVQKLIKDALKAKKGGGEE